MFHHARRLCYPQAASSMIRTFASSLHPHSSMRLPRLPVPSLRETLDRYLASVKPFLLEDERTQGIPFNPAFESIQQLALDFEMGIGTMLQERLIALDRVSPTNWLEDNFWAEHAYLSWRDPLLVNSNWWLAFLDDPLIPTEEVLDGLSSGGVTKWQILRAAWLVHRTLEFKDRVASQLHPATTKTGVWMQESTAKLFNVARIPALESDLLSQPPSLDTPAARSIYVTVHNFYYLVPVYDNTGTQIDLASLISNLRAVVHDATDRLRKGEIASPIGVLTADHRDVWAKNIQTLYQIAPQNKTTHESIIHSLMGLSLDASVSPNPSPLKSQQPHLDSLLHAIRGSPDNISNRFFDKPFTIIVDPAARAGAMGEHSVVDALVPSIVAEYGIVDSVTSVALPPDDVRHAAEGIGWSRLDWVADPAMLAECRESQERAQRIIGNSDDGVFWFEEYGAEWIREIARMSPDAFVQMALQLAWYSSRGEFTATYETALTRNFDGGRTETIRSFTTESRKWVLSMHCPSSNQATRLENLRKAVSKHTKLTREACVGRGIDRHLLGLRLLMRPTEGEQSPFLDHELCSRSTSWKLSSSGLSAGHLFVGTGFGAVYEDGYGINYLLGPTGIKFGVESKISSPLTSTHKFHKAIEVALQEMKVLCLTRPSDFVSASL